MTTPLQPREFFRGCWRGEGRLVPHPLLRWIQRSERLLFWSTAHWISDTVWQVNDRMEFSSGWIYERKMFAELVAPDRIHVTADDMPLGADIVLHEQGFRFTPYHAWGWFHGRLYRMRFQDECVLDAQGRIHDTIRMFYWGFPVATIFLGPLSRDEGEAMPQTEPSRGPPFLVVGSSSARDLGATKRTEWWIGFLLRILGGVCLLALIPLLMPRSWLEAGHQSLGLGPFPSAPIAEYLARSVSALCAFYGGLLLALSRDVHRFIGIIRFQALAIMLLSALGVWAGVRAGVPAIVVVGDALGCWVFLLPILILARRLSRRAVT